MRMEGRRATPLMPRLIAGVSNFGFRHPWIVLALTAISCGLSLWYTTEKLTYQTHRNDLIGKNKDYYKRWQQYVDEFGDDDDMVVVIRGASRGQMVAALEELAGEIEQRPELFDRLFYKADLRGLRNRALLYLPAEQIKAIQQQIQGMALLLDLPAYAGWKKLSLAQLMSEGCRKAQGWGTAPDPAGLSARGLGDEGFYRQLAAICRGAGDYLQEPGSYQSPWRSILPPQPGGQTDMLAEPHYFFSSDGSLASLLVRPVKEQDSFTYSQKSIDALRELLEAMRARFPDLEFGLTGLPVLENDEMIASNDDSNFAQWLALAGVVLLYLIAYRGLRYPLMTVTALLVGTAWALGWLTLTVGHLNILSSAFAVMLIGMGDYGVLWVTRFGQERRHGLAAADASHVTAMHVGPSILTAAFATALAFYAAMLADLKAVAELGWIAGSGVMLCALSTFVVMPPLLSLFGFRTKHDGEEAANVLSLEEHRAAHRVWLPMLMRRPYHVVIVSGVATLVLGYLALQIPYDHNLLNLQAPQMDSVQWERTLIEHSAGTSWHALSYTATPEEALALKAQFEQLPGVSQVTELASLVPLEQDRKREMLADIQKRLKRLPPRGKVIEHDAPKPAEVKRAALRLLDALAAIERPRTSAVVELEHAVRELLSRLDEAKGAHGTEETGSRLRVYEESMTRDLAEDLHKLRDVSTPAPIRLDDIPACLRERYIGKNGKWLVRIFSKECLWEFEPLRNFVSQVCTVDPDATGKPMTTLEGLRAMRNGFLWAGLYAFIAMVVVLAFDFASARAMVIALLPLAMGMIATLGTMYLLGATLNPANMIAFPLIMGVGADNGVHVMHDYRERDRRRRYMLSRTTGRGIMIAALTTILGFGTLMVAQHRGMASLGLALTIGVTCCMGTALVFLPALLGIMSEKREEVKQTAATSRAA